MVKEKMRKPSNHWISQTHSAPQKVKVISSNMHGHEPLSPVIMYLQVHHLQIASKISVIVAQIKVILKSVLFFNCCINLAF